MARKTERWGCEGDKGSMMRAGDKGEDKVMQQAMQQLMQQHHIDWSAI